VSVKKVLWAKGFLFSLIPLLLSLPAVATDCSQPGSFVVSILLNRTDAPTIVRMVQSQQAACSKANAEEGFARYVTKEFPGYRIVDVISTALVPGQDASCRRTTPGSGTREDGVNI
jgi:hypothetical protein